MEEPQNLPHGNNGAHSLGINPVPTYSEQVQTTASEKQHNLSLDDLHSVAADIKTTLTAVITELSMEIRAVTARVQEVELHTAQQGAALRHVNYKVNANTLHLRELNRQVEELENRSRRHNVRVRGLPESVETDQLTPMITGIFNNLLGRPPLTTIKMERIHRALRPRGKPSDPPRDIICHIDDFQLKENILRNARLRAKYMHEGNIISFYQDLSHITLQNRRDLKPLLDKLRDKGIIYKWKFPFGLQANNQGHIAVLRVPEDLQTFCKSMDIQYMDLPNWYADFRAKTPAKDNARDDLMETTSSRARRRRSQSSDNRIPPSADSVNDPRATISPKPRRARKEY